MLVRLRYGMSHNGGSPALKTIPTWRCEREARGGADARAPAHASRSCLVNCLVNCVGPAAGGHLLHGVLDLLRGHVAVVGCHRPTMAERVDDHTIAVAPEHVRHRHA